MKKLKKIDLKSAQSVMSFACPCISDSCRGNCSMDCFCSIATGAQTTNYSSTMRANTLVSQHGTQSINYS